MEMNAHPDKNSTTHMIDELRRIRPSYSHLQHSCASRTNRRINSHSRRSWYKISKIGTENVAFAMAPVVKFLHFSNGNKMPAIGLGTSPSTRDDKQVEKVVELALDIGYRHFDTAYFYQTEAAMGRALKKWLESGKGKREDLFIVSKLPWNGNYEDKVEHFLKLSLKDLQLDYVDLYLVHWPLSVKYISDLELIPKDAEGKYLIDPTTSIESVWRGMEKQVDAGRAKSIGVSNFNEKQIDRIVKMARIPPVNNQIELHLYFQQKEMLAHCRRHGITVCAYSPLGGPWKRDLAAFKDVLNDTVNLLQDPVVNAIAAKHKRTAAQVMLQYLADVLNVAVIPKSSNPERILSNFQIFDFKLDTEDTKELEALDKGEVGRSIPAMGGLKDHPECPF